MRQIKFRGKRVDNREWVEGSYHYSADKKFHYILAMEKFNERQNVNKVKGLDEMCLFKTEVHEVDPATVGQFTGLLDKNGKEIYEGDTGIDRFSRKVVVVWVDEFSCFALETIDDVIKGEYDFVLSDIFEINGNIHDNPKLIN